MRQAKSSIDEYDKDESDQRIAYAMEFKLAAKLTVCDDRFTDEVTGRVH
ncbi:hypothetical protein V7075_16225 [Neobacillus drentensis]